MCVGVALENVMMPEEKELKTIPGCWRLGRGVGEIEAERGGRDGR